MAYNGDYIALGHENNIIDLWDIQSFQRIKVFEGHNSAISSLILNNSYLISGSKDNLVCVWDIDKGKCIKILRGHTSWVTCLAYSENRIISGSADGTIRIWDIQSGVCIHIIRNPDIGYVTSIFYDGKEIIAGYTSGKILINKFPLLQDLIDETKEKFKNRSFTQEERKKYYLD